MFEQWREAMLRQDWTFADPMVVKVRARPWFLTERMWWRIVRRVVVLEEPTMKVRFE